MTPSHETQSWHDALERGSHLRVSAGKAIRQCTDDFVSDRPETMCDFIRRDAFGALPADENDFVAGCDLGIAHIDHQLVHGHHADDGMTSAADEDVDPDES